MSRNFLYKRFMARSRKSVLSALSADAASLVALHRDTSFAFVDFCLLVPSKDLDSLVWAPLLQQVRRAIEVLTQSAAQAAEVRCQSFFQQHSQMLCFDSGSRH
jgi:hypothetical protein